MTNQYRPHRLTTAIALALAAVVGCLIGMASASDGALLENRQTVYACAKDGGRVTGLRWDGPPRCRNGVVITWQARDQTNPTTTSTVASSTTIRPSTTFTVASTTTTTELPVADSVTIPFPTLSITTTTEP